MMMFVQNFVSFCQFVLKTLNKNQILTSIKGRNPVGNLQKTMIFITNIDLVTDNEHTNFGVICSVNHLVLKILSKNLILDMNQGP